MKQFLVRTITIALLVVCGIVIIPKAVFYAEDVANNNLPPHTHTATHWQCKVRDALLCIPRLSLEVPVVQSAVLGNAKNALQKLQNGVVLAEDMAQPGEEGLVFMAGHSSDAPWHKGNFKTVFVHLNALKPNDEIRLTWNQKTFIYTVYEVKIISPRDISFLETLPGKEELVLMTCWPPPTTFQRLIVRAHRTNL